LRIAHIEFKRDAPAAEPRDLLLEFAQRLTAPAREYQVCARFCQSAREVLSETPACSGDNGNLARQIKQRLTHGPAPRTSRSSSLFCRRKHDLHQIRLLRMKTFEPSRPFFQRRHRGNQRSDMDAPARD